MNKQSTNNSSFDIVYQSNPNPGSNIIDAELTCNLNGSSWITSQLSTTLSSGSGYLNYQPSLVQLPNNNIQVCWIRDLYGGGSNTPYYVNVVYCSSTSPSSFNDYGNMVNSVSLNILDGLTNTYFAYAQNTNNTTWQNFAGNGSSTVTLNTTGRQIQLCNGASSAALFASSYYPVSLPYYFQTSGSLGGLAKTTSQQVTYGRGAVLDTGSIQFYFSVKSLTVDNNSIKFVNIPETKDTVIQKRRKLHLSLDSLNTFLVSEPFTIQNGSQISFSEGHRLSADFGAADSALVKLLKNFQIGCKIELIEDGTNNLVGTIKQSNFNSTNADSSNLKSSSLKITSAGTKTVRLKIILSSSIKGVQGMLVNEYNTVDDNTLAKLSPNELTLQAPESIKTYALVQNYPNPFNPTTIINYQIPNNNYVTLKVYDVLGNLVKTLVDGYKTKGSYSVNFDASSIASGVYFYQLRAGNYTATKKLLLLK